MKGDWIIEHKVKDLREQIITLGSVSQTFSRILKLNIFLNTPNSKLPHPLHR
ncbi:MAG: hypothetical protein ACI8P3_003981 [Saprospiraceae bacterium]|jgi:hypothetical protein